ncbi:MAG: hypothetical protein QG650_471 [Patescibacteria group bacterium]|jgi:prepilin-type N-terminal cleavage/methylation domain-containing protein|nr:hypothetical protein [Patescibacteria group bacterium]
MRNSPLESNRAYALLSTAWHIVKSAFSSVSLILRSLSGKAEKPLPPNRFFEALHFLFVSGPRHYWKRPTAISAGRSVSTFLHFVLERDRRFVEKTNGKGFTLIELMVSISVVSLILVMGFQAFAQISAFRTNVNDRIDL